MKTNYIILILITLLPATIFARDNTNLDNFTTRALEKNPAYRVQKIELEKSKNELKTKYAKFLLTSPHICVQPNVSFLIYSQLHS